MDFTFYMPAQVFSGEGCLAAHFDRVAALGRRCLLVTGRHGAAASGALAEVQTLCGQNGIETFVFDGIAANPLLSSCTAAARMAQQVRAEFIIGIGGGSAMDAAKAIAWLAANRAEDVAGLYARTLPQPPLACVLIGTTAGTGSEVTAVSVLTVDGSGQKKSVTDPRCYARYVFADPRYTASMSPAITASTALDAFAHAAEGYLSPLCTDAPAAFAEKAMPLLAEGLRALCAGRNDAAVRQSLLYGSLWAGMVINQTGTAFPHPLGYILTEQCGTPHGMACAVFLPALLERAERYAPDKQERIAACFGGRDELFRVLRTLTAPAPRLRAEQIEACRDRLTGCKHYARTPGDFDAEQALALLRQVCGTEDTE